MSVPHSIRALSSRTGLSLHTIRAWERRYAALEPSRTGTNRRVYDERDVERLMLLKTAVERGHSIGQIARLPSDDLRRMLALPEASASERTPQTTEEDFLTTCLGAIDRLDSDRFEEALVRGGAIFGVRQMVESVILPLLAVIGQRWEHGKIRISHEHMASAVVRSYLDRVRSTIEPHAGAPKIVVTTPSGQVHELGALIVSLEASLDGWHVIYMGPNLPAEEVALVVRQSGARVVGLSLVYPEADFGLEAELREIRRGVGQDVAILVGGRAAPTYRDTLESIGAETISSLASLRETLRRLETR